MFTQLDPPLPLDTSRGPGLAVAVIDYGLEHDLLWVVGLDEGGEMWCVPNSEVRLQPNWSAKRRGPRYDPRRQAAGSPEEAGAG